VTGLEVKLQPSLDSGIPALVSLKDFDTEAPSNIDDNNITDLLKTFPASKSISIYVQSSFQIILRESLPLRLEILQIINDFRKEPSYDDVLRISHELTNICHSHNFVGTIIASNTRRSPLGHDLPI
jgi:hypothetical protein